MWWFCGFTSNDLISVLFFNFISFAIDCVERRPIDKNNVTQLLDIAITSIFISFAEFFPVQIDQSELDDKVQLIVEIRSKSTCFLSMVRISFFFFFFHILLLIAWLIRHTRCNFISFFFFIFLMSKISICISLADYRLPIIIIKSDMRTLLVGAWSSCAT